MLAHQVPGKSVKAQAAHPPLWVLTKYVHVALQSKSIYTFNRAQSVLQQNDRTES